MPARAGEVAVILGARPRQNGQSACAVRYDLSDALAAMGTQTPARYGASLIGTCVARSTRVEEDGFAADPSSGALVGHCHDRNRSFDLSPCVAALVWT
jgi:hypothetical protein